MGIINILEWTEKFFFKILNAISSEPLTILPILIFILVIGIIVALYLPNIPEKLKEIAIEFLGIALIIALGTVFMRSCMQGKNFPDQSIKKQHLEDNNNKTQ